MWRRQRPDVYELDVDFVPGLFICHPVNERPAVASMEETPGEYQARRRSVGCPTVARSANVALRASGTLYLTTRR